MFNKNICLELLPGYTYSFNTLMNLNTLLLF